MNDHSEKLLTISMADYLTLNGKSGKDFTVVGVEHSDRHRVWSGATLPSINLLEKRVRSEFLEKLPPNTVAVLSVQKFVEEIPSGFFSEGLQFVCYRGTALVAKTD